MADQAESHAITQLKDTSVQINRLMVKQLNRLNDTVRRLQRTDAANFYRNPSMRSRTKQKQALTPTMKTALEHQQVF